MEILDNKELLLPYINFPNHDGVFYFIQILQRKKENPDLFSDCTQRGRWFIKSIKELEIHWPRIVHTCEYYNARAYISINSGSLERLGQEMLRELSKRVADKQYSGVERLPEKLALSLELRDRMFQKKPWWLIDFDTKDQEQKKKLLEIISEIITSEEEIIEVPSFNGYHFLIHPFNYKLHWKKYHIYDNNYNIDGIKFSLKFIPNTIIYAKK